MHKILIIEDSKTAKLFLTRIIKEMYPDALITEAENGKEGFSALKTQSFNLIITDLEMGDDGGLEFVLKMQSNAILKKKKIIIYTSSQKPSILNSNVAFVSKTSKKEDLTNQIKKFLDEA